MFAFSCGEDGIEENPQESPFDRSAMLAYWADEVIIPAFDGYISSLTDLEETKNTFLAEQNQATLESLRIAWLAAYHAWQEVSIFDIGKAEELSLRNFTNIYPSDTEAIDQSIGSGDYNLELPSNFDIQGFPALDYLLYGTGENDMEILERLSTESSLVFFSDLVDRLVTLTSEVNNDWKGGYRDNFVNNGGSSATASVDKLTNDFLFFYERFLRAGKVGIPAGVFSGNPLPGAVEAPYSEQYSKDLFFSGFNAAIEFFNGVSHDGTKTGSSLSGYLAHVARQNGSANVADEIRAQWRVADMKAQELSPSFKNQILTDNTKMLETYDELQKAVVLLKVEMMQALNIQVDFVDADGD